MFNIKHCILIEILSIAMFNIKHCTLIEILSIAMFNIKHCTLMEILSIAMFNIKHCTLMEILFITMFNIKHSFHDGVYPKGIDSMLQHSRQKVNLCEGGILPKKAGWDSGGHHIFFPD